MSLLAHQLEPYQVVDSQNRFVAHDKHVLSIKDNNQSANIAALVDAGIRSFKIEGRYNDMAYVWWARSSAPC